MPEVIPKIPVRFVKERVPIEDKEPRTFFKVSFGDIYQRREAYFHGYDTKDANYNHVTKVVQNVKNRWKVLEEEIAKGAIDKDRVIYKMEGEFPFISDSDSFSSWFDGATSYGLYGIRDLKECLAKYLAARVSRNNIEFGSGAHMYTPSTCVDFLEEALLRNPSDVRLLFDLNTLNSKNRLPFRANSFDSATIPIVMSYIPDWKHFFKEVFRVLKPGSSSYILLWENAGGTVINEDGGGRTWAQPGPSPRLEDYLYELKRLKYDYFVENLVDFYGTNKSFKLIEVAEKLSRDKRGKIVDAEIKEKKLEKTVGHFLKPEILEFNERLKEKGIEASFVLPPWAMEEKKSPWSYESYCVHVYFHNGNDKIGELHLQTIREFKEFLMDKKGDINFYTTEHEEFDKNLKDWGEWTVKRFQGQGIDQCVYEANSNYLLKSNVICGDAAKLKESAFLELMEKVDAYLLYKALLLSKNGDKGNDEIIQKSEQFDRENPGMEEKVKREKQLVYELWKEINCPE